MNVRWVVHSTNTAHARALSKKLSIRSITAQLLLNRNIQDAGAARQFLFPENTSFDDPLKLPGVERSVARLHRAIKESEPILIFSDSDVDGLTAAAILYEVLGHLGARVRVKLSNRIVDGYGFPASALSQVCRSSTKLVVLVDCGTNQAAEIDRLSRNGIDTIIVDHHSVLTEEARPTAFINPQRTEGPGRELCSAGLAFKLAQALLGMQAPEASSKFLDLAALGTLADYSPLIGESRLIVTAGMKNILQSRRPGLMRLCEAMRMRNPNPEHICRRMVPRLNACGRLGDPTTAFKLLLEASDKQIDEYMMITDDAHTKTKLLHRRIFGEAQAQLDRLHFRDQYVLIVSRSGWHQGLMGPLAAQLASQHGRPTIAIAADGQRGTGSGRSIPSLNLLELLRSCEKLLVKFGGHAQACGLTVELKDLQRFRELVNQRAGESLGREGLRKTRMVDLELPLAEVDSSWVLEAQRFVPYGPGNPRPTIYIRGLGIEQKSPRIGWLTDGTKRINARGRFPAESNSKARYDVIASADIADGELSLTLSDVRASTAPFSHGQT